MKKAAKIIGIVVGGIFLLLALAVGIALLPSVQTWAVRKVVADQPGMKLDVGRVNAGFSSARIDDVRVEQNGMVVTLKGVDANYSVWDFLAQKRINADNVSVQDLVVDLRAVPPTATAPGATPGAPGAPTKSGTPAPLAPAASGEKAPPFSGVLSQARLPFDVRVARLSAKGRALLSENQTVVFDVQGADIETGKRGKIDFKVDFTDAKTGAPVSAIALNGTTGVRLTTDQRVDLIEVDATVSAQGQGIPADQIKLSAKAEQATAGANEGYTVAVSLVRAGQTETLLKGTAQFEAASRQFTGAWDLAVRSEQLAAVLAGLGLPELAATGAGKFSFKPDTGAAAATGEVQGNVTKLEKLAPELARIGSMQFHTTFDGGMADGAARLEKFQLDVTAANGRKIAQISTLQRIGFHLADKRVTLVDPKAELARVSVQALPLAWAQPFVKDIAIDSGDLSLVLAVNAEADGSSVHVRAVEPIALKSVTMRSGDAKLVDQLTLSVSPKIDYSATRTTVEFPDLKISTPAGDNVTGAWTANITDLTAATPTVTFTSQLQVRSVAAHRAYLPLDPGPITAALTADGQLQGDVLRVTKSTHRVSRENGALLASVEVQQPVTVNLTATTFTVPNPAATLARIQLGEVPLAWAAAFVPNSKLEGALAGAVLDVSARSADDLTLNTTEPFVIRGATVSLDGKPMARNLDLTANLTATKRGNNVAYEVRKVEIKEGQAVLATLVVAGEAKLGDKLALTAKGNVEVDAAALNQPAASQFATLSRGKFITVFDATMAEAITAKAVVSGRGLVAKQNNQALGDLNVNVDATLNADGSGKVVAPLTLTTGQRKSDLAIDGTFGKASDQKTMVFTSKIASNELYVDDFQPFAALAPASETKPVATTPAPAPAPRTPTPAPRPTTPAPAPAPGPKRDTAPFWAGTEGKVELDLKRIVYGKDYNVTNLKGGATITPSRLALDGLEGLFNQNPFKTNLAVTFNAQQAQPYTLSGLADVRDFDVGAILRASNPNEPPAMETQVSIAANLAGNGATVNDLAKNVYGKFELSGSKGVTRLLAQKGKAASAAVDIASVGLAILGAKNNSQSTTAVAELVQFFKEVPFDSLKVQVERGQDLQLKISSIELLSPVFRLTGSGTVANQPNVEIQNQPMNIVLQLGAKDSLAQLLGRQGALSGQPDEKGYQLMSKNFTVGGTPSKPDSASFWSMFLSGGLQLLQGLRR